MDIIYTNCVEFESLSLHAKFQEQGTPVSGENDFNRFTIYGRGDHFGYVILDDGRRRTLEHGYTISSS